MSCDAAVQGERAKGSCFFLYHLGIFAIKSEAMQEDMLQKDEF